MVPADSGRQAVFRAEEIDCTGLPVILAKDRGPGANLRRQAVVDARDRGRHLLPAELVGIDLRQWSQLVGFNRGRVEMQRLRILNVRFGR